jgi:outer membrane protein assembly factor BamB
VTFVDGKVFAKIGTDWQAVSIGDLEPTSASVRTGGASSCDIQFGKASAIRIGPDSTINLKTISLAMDKKVVDLGLITGVVTCKVNKLIGRDRFEVATQTAVCAVRGTQFAVSAKDGNAMTVAVQAGGVAILPPSFDASKLDAIANSLTQSTIDAVVDSIVAAAPIVAKGQELSISTKAMAKADAIVESVQGELASIPTTGEGKPAGNEGTTSQGSAPPAALSATIAQSIKEYTAAALVFPQKPSSLSTESKRLLEKAANLEIKESLPESPKETPPPSTTSTPVSAAPTSLKPSALRGTALVSDAGIVSSLIAEDDRLFGADSKGKVFAFKADGTVLWSAKTDNSENANSNPIAGAGVVAFAGDKSLAVLDASSGKLRYSVPLNSTDSGLFGRRPAIAGNKLFLATASGIKVFSLDSGESVGTIALSEDVETTPAVVGSTLYIVSVGGVFSIIDGQTLSVTGQIKTSATQPYAAAPIVSDGSAYFIDRKGLAVRIDLNAQTVAWSKRVDAGKNLNVLQDFALGDSGLYVFAKATIYGLSIKDGKRLFEPIAGVSSPPIIAEGRLWFGTLDDRIVAVDAVTGKTQGTLSVSSRVVGAPAKSGGLLVFPTQTGSAIFVDPAALLQGNTL